MTPPPTLPPLPPSPLDPTRKGNDPTNNWKRGMSIVVLTVGQVSSGLLVPLTQDRRKEYSYDPAAVIFYSELFKTLACLLLLLCDHLLYSSRPLQRLLEGFSQKRLLMSLVPSFAFFLTNNLIYEVFKHVDSTAFLSKHNFSLPI